MKIVDRIIPEPLAAARTLDPEAALQGGGRRGRAEELEGPLRASSLRRTASKARAERFYAIGRAGLQ